MSEFFTVTVQREAGQLWARVAELPGCFAAGSSWAELGESLGEAIALCSTDAGSGSGETEKS